MMLRASIESDGEEADLRGVTDGAAAAASGIPGAAGLVAFAEASLRGASVDIASARDRVRAELGGEAAVDAAAVIGNFERMVRIADGCGIPLDTPVNVATESIRVELGIDGFESASRTKSVSSWQRTLGRLLEGPFRFFLRRRARQSRRSKAR